MDVTKLEKPGVTRVLPTHELNARRRRKRTVAPNLPVADATQDKTPLAERVGKGAQEQADTRR